MAGHANGSTGDASGHLSHPRGRWGNYPEPEPTEASLAPAPATLRPGGPEGWVGMRRRPIAAGRDGGDGAPPEGARAGLPRLFHPPDPLRGPPLRRLLLRPVLEGGGRAGGPRRLPPARHVGHAGRD